MGCALRNANLACADVVCRSGANLLGGGVSSEVSASLLPWSADATTRQRISQKNELAKTCQRTLSLGPPSEGVVAPPIRSAPKPTEGQKRVRFDLERITVHAVRPYSETYGLHPREFVFEKGGFVVVPICKPPDVHEADEDSDCELADFLTSVDDDGWLLVG